MDFPNISDTGRHVLLSDDKHGAIVWLHGALVALEPELWSSKLKGVPGAIRDLVWTHVHSQKTRTEKPPAVNTET